MWRRCEAKCRLFRSAAPVLIHVDVLAAHLIGCAVSACILMGGLSFFWSAHRMSAGLIVAAGKST
jgi:hypothetical protein